MPSQCGVAVAAFVNRFFSNGVKIFEDTEQYLYAAWHHPGGCHWVNDFLFSTLLINQFEHADIKLTLKAYYSNHVQAKGNAHLTFLTGLTLLLVICSLRRDIVLITGCQGFIS